jgi:hypothetical protein
MFENLVNKGKKQLKKVGNFVSDNKGVIIGGTAAIAGMALGYYVSNKNNSKYRKAYKVLETIGEGREECEKMEADCDYDSSVCRDVDEDIFTDLAIKLENAVLSKEETYHDERWYDLDPLTHKQVTINVDTVKGD